MGHLVLPFFLLVPLNLLLMRMVFARFSFMVTPWSHHQLCGQFVDNMVISLHARFSDNADPVVMKALNNLFNPFLSDVSADCEAVSDYLGRVGFDGRRNELSNFASYSRALASDPSNKSLTDTLSCVNLAIQNRHLYPTTAEATERFLLLPVSTADSERGVSKQKLIKTTLRNRLSTSSLDNVMHMSADGTSVFDFPYKRAFNTWASAKRKRILQYNVTPLLRALQILA